MLVLCCRLSSKCSLQQPLIKKVWGERYSSPDIYIKRKPLSWLKKVWISIEIQRKFIPKCSINNDPALAQIMSWHRRGNKQYSEPVVAQVIYAYFRHSIVSIVLFQIFFLPSGEQPEKWILAYKSEQPTVGCIAIFHKYCCSIKPGGIITNLNLWNPCGYVRVMSKHYNAGMWSTD